MSSTTTPRIRKTLRKCPELRFNPIVPSFQKATVKHKPARSTANVADCSKNTTKLPANTRNGIVKRHQIPKAVPSFANQPMLPRMRLFPRAVASIDDLINHLDSVNIVSSPTPAEHCDTAMEDLSNRVKSLNVIENHANEAHNSHQYQAPQPNHGHGQPVASKMPKKLVFQPSQALSLSGSDALIVRGAMKPMTTTRKDPLAKVEKCSSKIKRSKPATDPRKPHGGLSGLKIETQQLKKIDSIVQAARRREKKAKQAPGNTVNL